MGWFDDQIKERIKNDNDNLEKSYKLLANSIMGELSSFGDAVMAKNAIEDIICFYGEKSIDPPGLMEEFYDKLEFMLRPTGIMHRSITLKDDWYKNVFNPIIVFTHSGEPTALLPHKHGCYAYTDKENDKMVKIDKNTSKIFEEKAICFYRPLPQKSIGIADLVEFILKSVNLEDIFIFVVLGLVLNLLGILIPVIIKLVFGTIIPSGEISNLIPAVVLSICIAFAIAIISASKGLALKRLKEKINVSVDNAIMGRILNLPAKFFKTYNAGELQGIVSSVSQLCNIMTDAAFVAFISCVFSVVYFIQIKLMTPSLLYTSVLVVAVQVFVITVSMIVGVRISRKQIKLTNQLNGLVFKLFSGIQKIKLAGAERRAFVKWAEKYSERSKYTYNPPLIMKIQPFIAELIFFIGSVLIYYKAEISNISSADYIAFISAYALISITVIMFARESRQIAGIKPIIEIINPVLEAIPENSYSKKSLTRISGTIEFNNVSFRYEENSPYIVKNMSLKIKSGEYIAVVGKTGCGKSTLIRLLLGFETPESGAIYYDNRDLQTIDLRGLRRNIGVVMQNGKLFAGDIYSNIVISAPWLSVDEAWEAARLAGIDEDIKNMPMGMQTLISEGQGGISGGQKQRIMIARAVAPQPKILVFDEATSALDNITQRIVSDSLDNLKCTRIVIAHRLSTIRQCDRVIVLDNGSIIEDGTYDKLLNAGGFFSQMVKRQML